MPWSPAMDAAVRDTNTVPPKLTVIVSSVVVVV